MTCKRWSMPSMFNKRDHVSENLLIYATNEELEWVEGAILDKLEIQKMKCMFALQRKSLAWHKYCHRSQTVFLFFFRLGIILLSWIQNCCQTFFDKTLSIEVDGHKCMTMMYDVSITFFNDHFRLSKANTTYILLYNTNDIYD